MNDNHFDLQKIWPEWKIVSEIGHGAYGTVYKIARTDMEYNSDFASALKIISIPQEEDQMDIAIMSNTDRAYKAEHYKTVAHKLATEFALMSQLADTSNIVSYKDHKIIEHDDGMGYDILIRMELLTPLYQYILDHGYTKHDIVQLGIDICKALELCGRQNIIHRDIKPENIFISSFGSYKLGDFGVAIHADSTTGGLSKKGTYSYMAPEVYKMQNYDSSVDQYSLGIVMYRLLNNGKAPFMPQQPEADGPDEQDVLAQRMQGDPLPYPVNDNGKLAEIVMRAASPDPGARFSSPAEMRYALEQIQSETSNDSIIAVGGASSTSAKFDMNSVTTDKGTIKVNLKQNNHLKIDKHDQQKETAEKQEQGVTDSEGQKDADNSDSSSSDKNDKDADNSDSSSSDKNDDENGQSSILKKLLITVGVAFIVVIIGILAGLALRGCSSNKDDGVEQEIPTITSEDPSAIQVEGIAISLPEDVAVDNQTYDMLCSFTPIGSYAAVSWSSSNDIVASIDQSGKLSAHSAGTVQITAITETGIEARCDVRVVSDQPTEYAGVDYAPVYDYNYYIAENPKIKAQFEGNPDAALEYFATTGISMGEQAISGFHVIRYAFANADVRRANGSNLGGYVMHYLSSGIAEGRDGLGSETMIDYLTEYNGVDYSSVYDYNYYIQLYPEVFASFGVDDAATLDYFVTTGMRSGNQASADFSPVSYAYAYKGVRERCRPTGIESYLFDYYTANGGFDYTPYYLDYMQIGRDSGLLGYGCDTMQEFESVFDGTDFSPFYDYNYYVQSDSDIMALCGVDDVAAFQHFVVCGLAEGRKGTENPGVVEYTTIYNGIDYSAVYDYNFYVQKYPLSLKNMGSDTGAVLAYFATEGMRQGQQGSANFDPVSYAYEYPDVRERCRVSPDGYLFDYFIARGGFDFTPYYNDYMNFGKDAGYHGAGCEKMQNAITVYKGTEWAPWYDYTFYTQNNPDIYAYCGVDDYATLEHYAVSGYYEGRQGIG